MTLEEIIGSVKQILYHKSKYLTPPEFEALLSAINYLQAAKDKGKGATHED